MKRWNRAALVPLLLGGMLLSITALAMALFVALGLLLSERRGHEAPVPAVAPKPVSSSEPTADRLRPGAVKAESRRCN